MTGKLFPDIPGDPRSFTETQRWFAMMRRQLRSAAVIATTLEGGEKIFCHPPEACAGTACCVHNRSDHHMRGWAQHYLVDRGLIERICPHGVGHPDPDDLRADAVHGCDGCCAPDLVSTDHLAEMKETLLRIRNRVRSAMQ